MEDENVMASSTKRSSSIVHSIEQPKKTKTEIHSDATRSDTQAGPSTVAHAKGLSKTLMMETNDHDMEPPLDPSNSVNQEKVEQDNCSSHGEVLPLKGPTLKHCKKLTDIAGKQYIELHDNGDHGLPYSAKLCFGPDTYWKLHGQDCLVSIGRIYVAQVSIGPIGELNDACDFVLARDILLKNLRTEKILHDQIPEALAGLQVSIKTQLLELGADQANHTEKAKCLLDLSRIAEKYSYDIDDDFCREFRSSALVLENHLKVAFEEYATMKNALRNRNEFQLDDVLFKEWNEDNNFLHETLDEAFELHKNKLAESGSPQIRSMISYMKSHHCMLLGPKDMSLLSDLENLMNDAHFETVVPVLLNNFVKNITNINPADCCQILPASNGISFHVYKSLLEIAARVEVLLGKKEIIHYRENKWETTLAAEMRSESVLTRCFETQLYMLIDLANHFEPGQTTAWKNFPYTVQLEILKPSDKLRCEQHLWLCLVDSTMMNMFDGCLKQTKKISDVLESFRNCLITAEPQTKPWESIRRMTHDTLEFLALFKQKSSVKKTKQTKMYNTIFQKQFNIIHRDLCDQTNRFCDYVSDFKSFWINLLLPQLSTRLVGRYLKPSVEEFQEKILGITYNGLNKTVENASTVKFLTTCTKLLTDLEDFPFVWYVRFDNERMKQALLEAEIVRRASNKLRGTKFEWFIVSKQCYDDFTQICPTDSIPKHVQVEIISSLLDSTIKLTQKHSWKNRDKLLTDDDQQNITTSMINAIRSSLIYLAKQLDFMDFDQFHKEYLEQFSRVIQESDSMDDFNKRAEEMKKICESANQQNEIAVDKLNVRLPLKECYKLFNDDKDQYIELRSPSASGLPYSAKFRYRRSYWKLHGAECLITIGSPSRFVATATIRSSVALNNADDFDTARIILLRHVQIDRMLVHPKLQAHWQELIAQDWQSLIDLSNTETAMQEDIQNSGSNHSDPSTMNDCEQHILDQTTDKTIYAKIFGDSLKHRGTLTDESESQYVKIRNPIASGAPYSAKFDYDNSTWRLHGEECLITIGTTYVARVSIGSIAELNDACDFSAAKGILLDHVKIEQVLMDQLQDRNANAQESLKTELVRLGSEISINVENAKCLLEVRAIGEKYQYKISEEFARQISTSPIVRSEKLKATINEIVKNDARLENRNIFLKGLAKIKKMMQPKNTLKDALEVVYANHKTHLLKFCSAEIGSKLSNIKIHCFLMLREEDVKLFSDMESALPKTMFGTVLPQIMDQFVERINTLKEAEYMQSFPLADEIYFHVCKGLVEMESRLEMDLAIKNAIEYINGRWKMVDLDKNKIQTSLSRCFVKQLEMFVNFANHFEPGKASVWKKYPYKFQLTVFQQADNLNSEHHLWLCVMDSTMANIFGGKIRFLEEYSAVTEMFKNCLSSGDLKAESRESIRILTHNTLELVAQIEQSGGLNEINKMILEKQLHCINQAYIGGELAFTQYRDITDVFKDFWKQFDDVLTSKFRSKYMQQQIGKLKSKLVDVISQVLDKNLNSNDMTRFFRAFNDFLMDLKELNFEWYVRVGRGSIKNILLGKKVMTTVENELKNTHNECYQVEAGKADQFVEICDRRSIPKHYQIEIMLTFLDYITDLMHKSKWKHNDLLTEENQLTATILLINAIRSSLMYLKEQPVYVDFEQYYEETIKPFNSVIEDSDSMYDFTKRAELIKDSFWYIRNQNSIGIDMVLQLCKRDNNNFNENTLKTCFELYKDLFETYMRENGTLDSDEKIQKIVQDVRGRVHPMLCNEWTAKFKQTTIPKILAGLGAVWSIMVSKDVARSGNYLKPHPIQILSVLRLLGIDEGCVGVEKHLAQILTGQGKSLTLGLVAAVLALFGHDVVVVCYSEYLTKRDSHDFHKFYLKFSITSRISYKTFDEMASHQISTLHRRSDQYVRKCIGAPLHYLTLSDNDADLANSVLLIDEVDVFFIDTFYGNTCDYVHCINIEGLGLVQEKIWELVRENHWNVMNAIKQYISSSHSPQIDKLKSFMARTDTYTLLNVDSKVSENKYTNMLLFDDHIKQMIAAAKYVHSQPKHDDFFHKFKIDDFGRLTARDQLGIFTIHMIDGYNNPFVYFKMRQNDFHEKMGDSQNYGYLKLSSASFSYSKLPERYPLILGVTGTLTGLSPYEKTAVENHYNIKRQSIMPSYFGGSNLKFCQKDHFQCLTDEINWRRMIFTRINSIINAHRSVIVFFDSEIEITKFKQDYEAQLDRVNEISVNTEPNLRERYIAEAGLTRTITLATRAMGRGVDYKSSLLVEKNGGIHIIQTFFSLDDKEETQIKGRTARKDNHGSYELIVCQKHLEQQELVNTIPRRKPGENNIFYDHHLFLSIMPKKNSSINYNYLNESRKRITQRAFEDKAQRLQESNARHKMTIEFYDRISKMNDVHF